MKLMNLKALIVALVLVCGNANAENLAESAQDSNIDSNINYAESSDLNANQPQDSQDSSTNPSDLNPTPSLRGSVSDEAIQLNSCIDCHDSTQSVESRNDESINSINDSSTNPRDSNANQSQDSQDSHSIFSPAPINGDTFGSFAVGYQMLSKRHSLSATNLNHSAFFALDRGWIFVDNALLFALSLDGSAGEFYSINIGAKLGYRALSGRIIPNIAVSYGLINHKINDAQHNFHGATATLSLFVDIAQGFGLEVAYRVGLHPFPTLKKTSQKANIHSFMVNLRFMDFGI